MKGSAFLAALVAIGSLNAGAQDGTGAGSPLPLLPIAEVLADPDGDTVPELLDQRVRVQGVVTIPPGILGGQFFQVAIQDETAGLMLFSYDLTMSLAPGDRVQAVGVVQQYRGAVQLQDIQIERLASGPLPEPVSLPLDVATTWDHLGELMRLQGVAGPARTSTFGTMQLTNDAGDSVAVYFPPKVMQTFPFGLYPEGSHVEAVGVMTLYKQSWPFDSGYQLIVTSPDQLNLLSEPPPVWQSWIRWVIGALALLALLVLAAIYWHYRRQKERESELATLNALSSMLGAPGLTREQLVARACEALTRYGLIDAAVIHLFDRYGHLRLAGAAGMEERLARELAYGGKGVVDEGGMPDAQAIARDMSRRDFHLLSLLPLTARAQPMGVITAFSKRSVKETLVQQRALVAGAKLIAMGLENMEVHMRAEADREELKQLAITDDLTGLYNRRFLDEYLRIQTAMATRRGTSLAFLAIDLDHFKNINDAHGHDAGDQVLIRVAGVIRDATRASDLPVRIGGEEFLVVITDTDVDGAMAFAERLRERIEALAMDDVAPGSVITPTISVGVAVFPRHGAHVRGVLRACDEALYRSKREGRNRVSLAGAPAVSVPATD